MTYYLIGFIVTNQIKKSYWRLYRDFYMEPNFSDQCVDVVFKTDLLSSET